jgi:hypothetical protein
MCLPVSLGEHHPLPIQGQAERVWAHVSSKSYVCVFACQTQGLLQIHVVVELATTQNLNLGDGTGRLCAQLRETWTQYFDQEKVPVCYTCLVSVHRSIKLVLRRRPCRADLDCIPCDDVDLFLQSKAQMMYASGLAHHQDYQGYMSYLQPYVNLTCILE